MTVIKRLFIKNFFMSSGFKIDLIKSTQGDATI